MLLYVWGGTIKGAITRYFCPEKKSCLSSDPKIVFSRSISSSWLNEKISTAVFHKFFYLKRNSDRQTRIYKVL